MHGRYCYPDEDRLGRLSLGSLNLVRAEVLTGLSSHLIPHGSNLIHANFHLDRPTMTLVVPTPEGSEPELSYLPPSVAYDPAARGQSLQEPVELLDTMYQTGHASCEECVRSAIAVADEYDGMTIVLRAGMRVEEPLFRKLNEQLRIRHGGKAMTVVASLAGEPRRTAAGDLLVQASD